LFYFFFLPVFCAAGFAENSTLEVKCVESSGTPVQNAKIVVANLITNKEKDKKSDPQALRNLRSWMTAHTAYSDARMVLPRH